MERHAYVRIITNDALGSPIELYYTNSQTRYKEKDPTGTGDVKEWEPRLASVPTVSQNKNSFVKTQVSITGSGITLINKDNALIDFVKEDYAWLNSEVKIWFEDLEGTVVLVFTGVVNAPKMSGDSIVFSIKSLLEKLKGPAYFGDDKEECIIDSTTYPNAPETSLGFSIPLVIGPHGKIGWRDQAFKYVSGNEKETYGRNFTQSQLHGILVDDSTYNYTIARVPIAPSSGSLNIACSELSEPGIARALRALAVPDSSIFSQGDLCTFSFSGSGTSQGYVYYIDNTRNLLRVVEEEQVSSGAPTLWPLANIDLIVSRDSAYRLGYNLTTSNATWDGNNQRSNIMVSKSASNTATAGGNILITGTLAVNNGTDDASFGSHGSDFSHENTIDRLFTNTGFTLDKINMSELTGINTLASYPESPNKAIPDILSVLSDLTTGLGVLINVKPNGDILYKAMNNTLTASETFDDTNILGESILIEKEYRDMANVLQLGNSIAENLYAPQDAYGELVNPTVQSVYNIDTVKALKHPHQSLSSFSSRIQAITKVPVTTYKIRVEPSYLDVDIGDEVRLNSSKYDIDQDCYVVGFRKTIRDVELTLLKPFTF